MHFNSHRDDDEGKEVLVQEFDDRLVCHDTGPCSYFGEQWSWKHDDGTTKHGLTCATHILSSCDVTEAFTWCEENLSSPGCFVLHAATWTNRGRVITAWLTGQPPGVDNKGPTFSVKIASS